MPVAALAGLAALTAVAAASFWSARRTRAQLEKRLRGEWGHPRDRRRDMAAVADWFEQIDPGRCALDDRAAGDLLIDEVFAWLDRTQSRVGEQVLYSRLRSKRRALDAFEALVDRVGGDSSVRERTQLALSRLQDPSAYYLHRLARPDAVARRPWDVLVPIWTGAIVALSVLSIVWPPLLVVVALSLLVNVLVRIITGHRVAGQIASFRQLGPLLSAARDLRSLGSPETASILGTLRDDLAALRRIGAVARWVSRDPSTTPDVLFLTLEYLNLLLLMDVNALFFAAGELRTRGPALLRAIEAVGEVDAAVAVASVRAGATRWTRPTFIADDEPAVFADVCHPLIAEPVPNSIELGPPYGVIVTGSNMSGKSTFLRTVGINIVLAQSVHTCLATRYRAPFYEVRTCIGRADDLAGGTSYYQAEVDTVVSLLRASERRTPQFFIIDELFRGTNAVERIAAGAAVLSALVEADAPHVALLATHDAELVDLLRDTYLAYHLADALEPDGLTFEFRLTPGPATSRDAIALLRLGGAPGRVIDRALAQAAALDRRRARLAAETG